MDTLFFVASKVFWLIVRPETWLLLALVLAVLFLRRQRYRATTFLLSLAIGGFVLIGVFPLGDLITGPLESRFPANPPVENPSHIIVLGGAEVSDLTVAWDQPQLNAAGERFLYGIMLAHRFPEADLVFTGGSGALFAQDVAEASIAASVFLGSGISSRRLKLENTSRNTAENARNTFAMLEEDSLTRVVLVTSASHMPRALATFCSAGWRNLVAWPVDYRSGLFWDRTGWNLAGNLDSLNKGAKEWIGFLAYRVTGRISSGFADGC